MAFEGNLQNIHLSDIFQTLTTNRQTGTLIVRSGDREKRFGFGPKGVASLSRRTLEGSRLGEFLIGRGLISEADLKLALMQQRRSGYPLGRILVEKELVEARQVEAVLRYHAAEEIYDVFGWKTGQFQFLEGESITAPGEASPFAGVFFDPGGIVMEAARRLDEWELIRETFPTPRDFLNKDRPLEEGELEDQDLLQLLDLCDGTRDLDNLRREFYLSPFDLQRGLKDMVQAGLVRKLEADELSRLATPLIEHGDLLRAIRMLERSWELDQEDSSTLELLAKACQESGDTGAASAWLVTFAGVQYRQGRISRTTELAREALVLDDQNLEAIEILGTLSLRANEPAEAVELTCRRVAILRERKEFGAGAQVCEQILEIPECDSLELRIHHASCLAGSRQTERAIQSFEVAAELARCQGRIPELGEVLRRILLLDPEHEQAKKQAQALRASEIARRRRRAAMIVAGAIILVVGAVGLMVMGGDDGIDEQIVAVHMLVQAKEWDKANRLLVDLDGRVADDDDRSLLIANLRADISRRMASTPKPGAESAQELADGFGPLLAEAASLFAAIRIGDALDCLESAGSLLDGDLGQRLKQENAKTYANVRADNARQITVAAHEGLESVVLQLQSDKDFVGRLHRKELIRGGGEERDKSLRDSLERILTILNRTIEPEAVRVRVEAFAAASGGDQRLSASLERLEEEVEHAKKVALWAEEVRHVIQAQLKRSQVTRGFGKGMANGREARDAGRLEEAVEAFGGVLEFFREIEGLQPPAPYAALVSLITEQGLKTAAVAEMAAVEDIQEQLALARLALEERRFDETQRIYLGLLEAHPVIDFSVHIELPLYVTSRPSGAEVRLDGAVVGRTPIRLDLRYAAPSEIAVSLPTFRIAEFRVEGADEPGPATRHIDLDKLPRWTVETGSPMERCSGAFGDALLISGRDGRIHLIDADTGERGPHLDAELIEGFTGRPALDGSLGWLAATDGTLIRVDRDDALRLHRLELKLSGACGPVSKDGRLFVVTKSGELAAVEEDGLRWRTPLPGKVLDAPVVHQGRILIGTNRGHVLAISSATGAVLWSREVGSVVRHSPLAFKNLLLVGLDSGVIHALDLRTGEPRWSREIGCPLRSRLEVHFGVVFAGADDGCIHRLSLTNGNPVDKLEVGGPVGTDLVIRDGRLFLGTRSGRACAFDLEDGTLLWSYDLGSAAAGTPIVVGGITVFVSSRGTIVAFD